MKTSISIRLRNVMNSFAAFMWKTRAAVSSSEIL